MTPIEGQGTLRLLALARGALKKLPRETARSFVDGLEDRELADLMNAASSADVASGGTGDLLYESAAARLRGVDVETHGSAIDEPPMWRMLTNSELMHAQGVPADMPLVQHRRPRHPQITFATETAHSFERWDSMRSSRPTSKKGRP